jgi:flagellar FliL protein
MKKMIMMVGGALVLVGASVGGTLFLAPKPEAPAAAVDEDGNPIPVPPPAAALPLATPLERHYYNIHPEFVVNFGGQSAPKFLMIEMTAATSDEKAHNAIDDHIPELRNNLLMMLGEQKSKDLESTEGKDALREKAFELVEEVVAKHYGPGRVTDVFFTRFVMQ